jgi:ribosomal protein S18 acetylase RimI-like enzyme
MRCLHETLFAVPAGEHTRIGYIDMCRVAPEGRRQGIAKALVQAIEHWFQERGITYIDLHYLIGNDEAEKAWARLGYKPYRIASRKEI